LYNLSDDIGETKNLALEKPEKLTELQTKLEEVISRGRSTAGEPQNNDVKVERYPEKPKA
jgi:hypothetical protein